MGESLEGIAVSYEEFREDVRRRMGVNTTLANRRSGLGCLGWAGGFVFLFLFWPLGLALLLISFLSQIVRNQRSGSERAAMAVADAEALRLWEERRRSFASPLSQDPLFRSAEKIYSSLEEVLEVGERLPPGPLRLRRSQDADQLLEELFVICEEIAFLSPSQVEQLEWRVDQLKQVSSPMAEPEFSAPEEREDG